MAFGLVLSLILFYHLTDVTFWERMTTLKHVELGERGLVGAEGGAHRTSYWFKGLDLVKEYPLGVGGWGYLYLSPQFIAEDDLVQEAGGMRAPHSTWIDALVDYGYVGFILFLGMIFSCFNLSRKVRKHLLNTKNYYLYYQNVAIDAGFLAFLGAGTFIDRLNAETMYWFPAFLACFANIYLLKGYSSHGEKATNEIGKKRPE